MLCFPPPFKPLNCTSKPITSKNNKKGFVAASVSQQNCSPFLWGTVTVLLRQSHSPSVPPPRVSPGVHPVPLPCFSTGIINAPGTQRALRARHEFRTSGAGRTRELHKGSVSPRRAGTGPGQAGDTSRGLLPWGSLPG